MKRMKQISSLAIYDIGYSFRKNKYKWCAALIILAFLAFRSIDVVTYYGFTPDLLSTSWSVMSGAREYLLSADRTFELPAYWFLFHIYLSFLVGFYTVSELRFSNGHAITRTYSRTIWLASKLFSIIVNIILYYSCFFLFLLVGILFTGGTVFPSTGVIGISGVVVGGMSIMSVFLKFWLLPMIVSVTLCLIQVIASLFFEPVLSFLCTVGYLIASVFWTSPILIGNFAMLLRQNWLSGKPLLNDLAGVFICIAMTSIVVFVGVRSFQKKDILSEE